MNTEHSLTPYINMNLTWIRPKCKTRYYKALRSKHKQSTHGHKLKQYLFGSTSQINESNNQSKQMGPN